MPRARRAAYGKPAGPSEWRALREALALAFAIPPKHVPKWIRRAGPSCFRVIREEGEVAGGLALYPFGHWFGGRRVPAAGVAGVAILPQFRALGIASRLMREALGEMSRDGIAISTLYPATWPVYRRAGWEAAGHFLLQTMRVADIDARERAPVVRAARPSDRAAIRALYRESARRVPGMIDRTEYFWWRALGKEDGARTWVVGEPGRVEGYVIVEQEKQKAFPWKYDLWISDFAFANAAAGRRLLSFLAAHRSIAVDMTWPGGPAEPLLGLVGEPFPSVKRHGRWMLRVVDLAEAVARRGFAAGVRAEVGVEVADDVLEGNRGTWTLRVADGRGRAVRGGKARVRVDARGLAPLYTGFQSPFDLRTQGRLDGPDGDLEALASIFAGPAPWMRDGF